MQHSQHFQSFWFSKAIQNEVAVTINELRDHIKSDICIVGGGFTGLWTALKLKEKKKKSILSGVPNSLPSMLKSYRIQEKVKGIGFNFLNTDDAFEKVIEEIKEFKSEINNKNTEKASEEFGDILFSLIGYGQMIGVNSMNALEKTNKKFAKAYFHWFFLIQPKWLPENMIKNDSKKWMKGCLDKWSGKHVFGKVEEEYLKAFKQFKRIHASCEDYRASATIDLEHDRKDRAKIKKNYG